MKYCNDYLPHAIIRSYPSGWNEQLSGWDLFPTPNTIIEYNNIVKGATPGTSEQIDCISTSDCQS